MEGKIKALDRKLLIKATKTMLYLIPIIGITNRVYVMIYGEYELDFNGFVNFAEKHAINLVVAFLIFACLFLFFYFLEQFLLPVIFIATNSSKLELDDQEKQKIGHGYTKIYGLNFLKLADEPFIRFELIGDISFLFIVPILWLVFLNHWIGYLSVALLCVIFWIIAKGTVILLEPDNKEEDLDTK
jgi:hypothetical protein